MDTTVYSTSSDGHIYCPAPYTDYDTVHDHSGAGGIIRDFLDSVKPYHGKSGANYYINRGFLPFVHGLSPGDIVTAATLYLYGSYKAEADAGLADLGIVEGIQHDPLQDTDYGDELLKTILGADTYYDFATFALDAYNPKPLNAIGIGWIQAAVDAGALVKLCLRQRGDIEDTQPAGVNRCEFWAEEKGAGKLPYLVITYTPPTASIMGRKTAYDGYRCFIEQYVENKIAGSLPLKLPDGTKW